MKKLTLTMLVLGILAMLMAGTAQAQMKMEFGVKGAFNLANVTGDVENNKMMMAFGGGIFARMMPSPQFTIQPEVLFMMKGTKFDDFDLGGVAYTDAKWVYNYVEIPVLAKYMIPMEGNISPNIFAGPALGLLMSAKEKGTADGEDYDVDIKDLLKSIDFGVAFGAGVDVAMGEKGKLTFDARYTLGLTNTLDVPEGGADVSVKNANISVMVGYAFAIGGGE